MSVCRALPWEEWKVNELTSPPPQNTPPPPHAHLPALSHTVTSTLYNMNTGSEPGKQNQAGGGVDMRTIIQLY